jgi:hypothetical protein
MGLAVGKYEPNITTGLVLPVVRKREVDDKIEEFINMELVPSHIEVECGDETKEMAQQIEEGLLICNKYYDEEVEDAGNLSTISSTT